MPHNDHQQWVCNSGAVVRELAWRDPEVIFSAFAHQDFALWLDSSDGAHQASYHSYICLSPYKTLCVKNGQIDGMPVEPFDSIKSELAKTVEKWTDLPEALEASLPDFRGGAAGFFGYDLAQGLERLPPPKTPYAIDDAGLPDLTIGFYDGVLSFNHQQQRCFLISTGFPEQSPANRTACALERADKLTQKISALPHSVTQADQLAPPLARQAVSDVTAEDYKARIQRVIDYIYAGDIFQATLSHRFTAALNPQDSDFDFYRRLRKIAPAPFSAFGRFGDIALLSASPERFISCAHDWAETQPIKGTRPRGATAAEDKALRAALVASAKECAENVMIVDLLRNDLSRSCEAGTMSVPDLCRLESFSTVHHLVSTIRAKLRPDAGPTDVLKAAFPGGSVSGVPKIRAMEIIAELENNLRGPYCGAFGYIGFDGKMDTNILIRTALVKGDEVSFQVGGGITANSQPEAEYFETLDKARGILEALGAELPQDEADTQKAQSL